MVTHCPPLSLLSSCHELGMVLMAGDVQRAGEWDPGLLEFAG